ncbi:helix-turn-helix domain-containing protein [Paenibacillus polymyxa]|uniref:helix-turn-helix domain-containing protein n=1 Tax=Paenibacillus polymyxa TaxID=1406 RepID=UPI0020257407|nr:helix-turn-helix transcriptional regulator [Paenibacillus polymyxa]WDZ54908.1 helix-turn-helix transcriptional regulator [Paenibacillus polymyxa]
MPKVKLTEELSRAIKNTRNDRGIKAADLSKYIDRSLAYISKLENNNAEFVDLEVLYKIFEFLLGKKEDFLEHIQPLLEKTTIELTPDEIKEQEWIQIFDLEYRQIPIPDSLITFITKMLNELNLTAEEVILEMNKNEELSDQNILHQKTNSLIFERNQEKPCSYIVFDLKDNLLQKILSKQINVINYITMEGIVRTLYKMQGASIKEASEKAVLALNEHKFFSLYEKKELLQEKIHGEELDMVLTEFDKKNMTVVNTIMKHIKILSDWNIDYANRKLKNLEDSFETDPSFILAIIGSEFFKLANLDKEEKKVFLTDLSTLIDKHSDESTTSEEKFEEY